MDQQGFARRKVGEDVFERRRSARTRLPTSRWPCSTAAPAQIGAIDLGTFDQAAFHRGKQATANGFDFGQFGHISSDRSRVTVGRIEGLVACAYKGRAIKGRQVMNDSTTHFGYQTVPEADKAGMVHGVFTRVASKYDIMNDLMSGGMHRLWKDAMMDRLAPRPGQRLLDGGRHRGCGVPLHETG